MLLKILLGENDSRFKDMILHRVVGEATMVQAYKIRSWLRRTECKLAWFGRTAAVIRFYLLQYDINTSYISYL